MANENEMVELNYAKAMAKVDELCHKVVEDPRLYAACVIDEGCTYIIPVIKILSIAETAHKRELEKKDALIKELADALKKIDDMCDGDACKFFINTEHCSKCKYLEDCSTGVAHNVLKKHESEIAKAREATGVSAEEQDKEVGK